MEEIEVHFANEKVAACPILDDQMASRVLAKAWIVGLAVVSATGRKCQQKKQWRQMLL